MHKLNTAILFPSGGACLCKHLSPTLFLSAENYSANSRAALIHCRSEKQSNDIVWRLKTVLLPACISSTGISAWRQYQKFQPLIERNSDSSCLARSAHCRSKGSRRKAAFPLPKQILPCHLLTCFYPKYRIVQQQSSPKTR